MRTRPTIIGLAILVGVSLGAGCEQGKELDNAAARAAKAEQRLATANETLEKVRQEKTQLVSALKQKTEEIAQLQTEHGKTLEQLKALKTEMQVLVNRQNEALAKSKQVVEAAGALEKHLQDKLQQVQHLEELTKELKNAINAIE